MPDNMGGPDALLVFDQWRADQDMILTAGTTLSIGLFAAVRFYQDFRDGREGAADPAWLEGFRTALGVALTVEPEELDPAVDRILRSVSVTTTDHLNTVMKGSKHG